MNGDILKWLENWYSSNCNEDWEHMYGIKIGTLDNPGWDVRIDLKETEFENETVDRFLYDNGDDDWYSYEIIDAQFIAYGDPTKLSFLLGLFRKFIEERTNKEQK
ncbi:MAG: immunity 53 family protein [bacterium]